MGVPETIIPLLTDVVDSYQYNSFIKEKLSIPYKDYQTKMSHTAGQNVKCADYLEEAVWQRSQRLNVNVTHTLE